MKITFLLSFITLYTSFYTQDTLSLSKGRYIGKIREGKQNGFGKLVYYNGDVYEEHWVKGQKLGKGIMFYNDGRKRTQIWENGTMISETKE